MANKHIHDSDIVDVLLGEASPEVERRIADARAELPEFATVYDGWVRVVTAAQRQAVRQSEITDRTRDRVMSRIRAQGPVRHDQAAGLLPWHMIGGRRPRGLVSQPKALLALTSVAICVLIFAAIEFAPTSNAPEAGIATETEVGAEDFFTFVGFQNASNEEIGSLAQPYKTLLAALHATPEGGTITINASDGVFSEERIRIARSVRLEAVGGTVRIGRSD